MNYRVVIVVLAILLGVAGDVTAAPKNWPPSGDFEQFKLGTSICGHQPGGWNFYYVDILEEPARGKYAAPLNWIKYTTNRNPKKLSLWVRGDVTIEFLCIGKTKPRKGQQYEKYFFGHEDWEYIAMDLNFYETDVYEIRFFGEDIHNMGNPVGKQGNIDGVSIEY